MKTTLELTSRELTDILDALSLRRDILGDRADEWALQGREDLVESLYRLQGRYVQLHDKVNYARAKLTERK